MEMEEEVIASSPVVEDSPPPPPSIKYNGIIGQNPFSILRVYESEYIVLIGVIVSIFTILIIWKQSKARKAHARNYQMQIDPCWPDIVTPAIRNNMVAKVTRVLLANLDPEQQQNQQQVMKLRNYAREIEEESFRKTNSQFAYYDFLAMKISTIDKDASSIIS